MRKNIIYKALSVAVAATLLTTTFSACGVKKEESGDFYKKYSVINTGTVTPDIQKNKSISGKDGDSIRVDFKEKTDINTVVLKEHGDNVLEYEISVKDDLGEYITIYKQDKIGPLHYCAFDGVKTDSVKVTINKTRENTFSISEIDVLNAKHSRDNFEVRSYAVVGTLLNKDSVDAGHLSTITDLILFGAITFDEEGHLRENEFQLDDKKITGKEALKIAIDNINIAKGENNPRIFINILGPDGDVESKEKKHNVVFKEHSETLIKEINDLINEFNFDGIYFDYEYPYKKSGMKAYNKFLVELNENMPEDKMIGVALGPWGQSLDKKAQQAVDNCELMTYDMFDNDGYHATFQTVTNGLKFAKSKKLDIAKCTIGLPFYGRPTDKAGVWTDYAGTAQNLGKFNNLDTSFMEQEFDENGEKVVREVKPRYLNSYQMIYDKTAFAYDAGIDGVMIWHYACDTKSDTEYSLFNAIKEAQNSRK